MKKIRLDLDALHVDSFDTAPTVRAAGTVRGHGGDGASYPNACDPPSDSVDPAFDTCGYGTCAGSTCWQSCNGSCNCNPTGGCGTYSAGYTLCLKDASCVDQCDPIG